MSGSQSMFWISAFDSPWTLPRTSCSDRVSTACQTRLIDSLQHLPTCSEYKARLQWRGRFQTGSISSPQKISLLTITIFRPLQVFLPKAKYYEGLKTINSFVDPFITRTLALGRRSFEEMEGSEEENNFLEGLATFTQDPKVIRDQLIFVLLAARDTTAATLARTLYELSGHPEVVQRLREEILAQVGTASAPTYADLKNMRYLQAILKETLRLYPAIPFNMRVALSDTTLPSGGGPSGTHRSM